MKVLLAQHSGFCFGVKRAIQLAQEAAKSAEKIFTIGPLIHNPQMIAELQQQGIFVADDPLAMRDSVIIIRTHGIPKSEKELLINNRNRLIDATCPYVARAQEIVAQCCAEGYPVVIMGDRTHPEVIGMKSYGDEKTQVAESATELHEIPDNKLAVMSQTTKNMAQLHALISDLLPLVRELRVFNTICTATSLRQDASIALAQASELMIVIGGRNSANTKMLAKLCAEITQTVHMETAAELSTDLLKEKKNIGITAGASTPDYLIVKVFNRINEITGDRTTVTNVADIPVY